MSDLTLDAYAQDLIADVLATAEAESATTPETFTRRALDDLEQAGRHREHVHRLLPCSRHRGERVRQQ